MAWFGEAIAGVGLAWNVGKALMGRPSIVTKQAKACDFTFIERNMGAYRQWALRVQTTPQRLEFRIGVGFTPYFQAHLDRRGLGRVEVSTSPFPGTKHCEYPEAVVVWWERVDAAWVSDQTSDWEIEIKAPLGRASKTLYKGNPTQARIERDP